MHLYVCSPESNVASLSNEIYGVRRSTRDVAGAFSNGSPVGVTIVNKLNLLGLSRTEEGANGEDIEYLRKCSTACQSTWRMI